MIRAVAVDMDGTFLRSDSTYDRPRFMRLLERLREADVRFIAASGNQAARLRHYFEDDPRVSYVAENGHYVYEGGTNLPLYAAPPLGDGGQSIVRALESVGSPCVVSTRQGALMPSWAAEIGLDWARRHFLNLCVVADLFAHSGEIVAAAVNTTEPHETALTLERLLVDIVEVVVSGPADLDLNSPGHSKATGLTRLLKSWGVGLPELVAIGDSLNDMDMLRAAGTAVAVANAHPRILAIADHIAPANDLDGALDVLEWVLSHT